MITKVSLIFTSIIIFILSFSSCDIVDLPNDGTTTGPGPNLDTRRAIIMDFTGHRCQGCPAAGKIAGQIADQFPDQVFVMSVHPDLSGLTTPIDGEPGEMYTTDWRTPEGNYYQLIYNIPTFIPLGGVNATEIGGNLWTQSGTWQSEVESIISMDREINIDLELDYNENSRELSATADIKFDVSLDDNYLLVFAVVENNITDWQKNGTTNSPSDTDYLGGDIPNYVHKHVLRKHLNGLQGSEVNTAPVDSGQEFQIISTEVLSEDYVAEEVTIFAYIYNSNTLEILDVVEKHIIE